MPKYVGVQTNAMKLLIYKICASLRPIRREDDTSAKCCHHEIKFFVQPDVFLAMIFGKLSVVSTFGTTRGVDQRSVGLVLV